MIKEHGGRLTFFAAPKMVGLDTLLGLYEDESSALAGS